MKIAITGHRPNKLGNDYDLKSTLILLIKAKILQILLKETEGNLNNLTLITGMALGIDTLFAQIAIELNIPFIAAIPFKGQETAWSNKSQKIYNDILNNTLCTKQYITEITPSEHTKLIIQAFQLRNEWMVDNCDILISVWDGSSGGTANCHRYAGQQIGRPDASIQQIIRINPKEL